jgi:putative dehydrogenase
MTPVAVIGAGNMGGAMVQRLLDRGWPVWVVDTDAKRQQQAFNAGAQLCTQAAEAAAHLGSEGVLMLVVVDAAQCETVLWGEGGAAHGLKPGHTVVLCPTIAPQDVESIAQRLQTQGVATIDAPMSGGPARARDGSMSLMLAAPAAELRRRDALLSVLSSRRFVVSERQGDGARTKLVNNLLAGINLVGAAEALALATRLGLDAQRTLDVIAQSSGQSWIGSDRMARALAGDWEPRAHTTLLAKDTGLAVAMAQTAGFEGPLGPQAAAVFARACEAGWSELDDAALLPFLQGRVVGAGFTHQG